MAAKKKKKRASKKRAKTGARSAKQKAAWVRTVKKAKAFVAKWGDTV